GGRRAGRRHRRRRRRGGHSARARAARIRPLLQSAAGARNLGRQRGRVVDCEGDCRAARRTNLGRQPSRTNGLRAGPSALGDLQLLGGLACLAGHLFTNPIAEPLHRLRLTGHEGLPLGFGQRDGDVAIAFVTHVTSRLPQGYQGYTPRRYTENRMLSYNPSHFVMGWRAGTAADRRAGGARRSRPRIASNDASSSWIIRGTRFARG